MDTLSPENSLRLIDALEALRLELIGMIEGLQEAAATVELDQGQQGRLSRVDAIQAQRMAQAQQRRAQQRLERVEHILTCRGADDFGCCGDCGEVIPMPRLLARPDAVLCVECADAR